MKKLNFEIVKDTSITALVLDKIEYFSGVRLPMDYARNSKLVVVRQNDKLVAGYMIVTKPPFRSIAFVPDGVAIKNSFFRNSIHDMIEVNGFWISPAVKSPYSQLRIWWQLAFDVFSERKNFVLLMRNEKNSNMQKFFCMVNPTNLYLGSPQLMAGESSHEKISVSYCTRWQLVKNLHRYAWELFHRQSRRFRRIGGQKRVA